MKRKYEIILILFILLTVGLPFLSGDSNLLGKMKYRIGKRGPAGGWIFYDKGNYSNGWRYLEAAPEDLPGTYDWEGGWMGKLLIPGSQGTAIGTGKSNSHATVNQTYRGKEYTMTSYPARMCMKYDGGGKNDWFLPSKDELNLIFKNLEKKDIGDFKSAWYWSSSQKDEYSAWAQFFYPGKQYGEQIGRASCRERVYGLV